MTTKKDKAERIIKDATIMQERVKQIEKDLRVIVPKIDNMHDTFIRGEGKIMALNKEVFGNGKPSLRNELHSIRLIVEKKFAYYAGAIAVMTFIISITVQKFIIGG